MTARARLLPLAAAIGCLLAGSAPFAQQRRTTPPPAPRRPAPSRPAAAAEPRLGMVRIEGAKRYAAADVVRLSGLVTGQAVTRAALDAAVKRLAATGLFTSVGYRSNVSGRQMTVVFDVAESAWTVPVVFDNFIGFTDDELTAGIRALVPSFDGTAPIEPGAAEFIQASLQTVAQPRLPGRTVTFTMRSDLATRRSAYVFAVTPGPTLCSLSIGGAIAPADPAFADAVRPNIGREYSRAVLGTLSAALAPLYQRHGRWKVAFGAPAVEPASGACTGVAASIPVDEGKAYGWAGADWVGAVALTPAALDKLLPLKPGQLATIDALETGVRRIRDEYDRRGHIRSAVTWTPRLDDAAGRAVFEFRIQEGPQFRMGTLEFAGVTEREAARLRDRFRLKAGDVYDGAYIREFMSGRIIGDALADRARSGKLSIGTESQVDTVQNLVNVRYVFK